MCLDGDLEGVEHRTGRLRTRDAAYRPRQLQGGSWFTWETQIVCVELRVAHDTRQSPSHRSVRALRPHIGARQGPATFCRDGFWKPGLARYWIGPSPGIVRRLKHAWRRVRYSAMRGGTPLASTFDNSCWDCRKRSSIQGGIAKLGLGSGRRLVALRIWLKARRSRRSVVHATSGRQEGGTRANSKCDADWTNVPDQRVWDVSGSQ